MAKKKEFDLMDNAKDTIKLGITSQAGMFAIGSIGAMPGMPKEAAGITSIAGAGLTLANVGQLGKTGIGVASMFGSQTKSATSTKKVVKTTSSKDKDFIHRII
jgi:hypothetical protein